MAFTLKVKTGPGAGSEFAFDQLEVTLGRTADNDIVVNDAGASRSHARLFAKDGRLHVEDLGSANGTKLNGEALASAMVLRSGDEISIGVVTFTYAPHDATLLSVPDTTAPSLEKSTDPDLREVERPGDRTFLMQPATVLAPAASPPHDTKERPALGREVSELKTILKSAAPDLDTQQTILKPPSKPLPTLDDDPPATKTKEVKVGPPKSLAAKSDAATDEMAELSRQPQEQALSAAERARLRREAGKSLSHRVRYEWSQLSPNGKKGAALGGGVLGLVLLAGVLAAAWPKSDGPKASEPSMLEPNARGLRDSFGLGDDVTWRRPDMKIFDFALASPTRMVAVVHYQARDVSKDEVAISLNGSPVSTVPPDTMDPNRELELVLPADQLKLNQPNQLVFDSTLNPPAANPWRVSHVWLESIPVPDISPEETVREAKEAIGRADKLHETKDVGPDNLFRAWKTYREAWLFLESVTDRPTDVTNYARTRMREVRPELDQRCNGLMLDVQKLLNAKPPNQKLAITKLKDVERYFPTREHPCNAFAKAVLEDLGEW